MNFTLENNINDNEEEKEENTTYWLSRWDLSLFNMEEALEKSPTLIRKRVGCSKPRIGDKIIILATKGGGVVARATVQRGIHEYYDNDPYETPEGKKKLKGVTKGVDLLLTRFIVPDEKVFSVEGISRIGPWSWKKINKNQYNQILY